MRCELGPRLHMRIPMKTLLVAILVTLAACGGSSTPSQHPTAPTEEARVDPTIPSWLPQSCVAYQKAVVQAINCQAVDQTKRDEIQKAYGEKSTSWKAEDNADSAKVNEIGATCRTATGSVRADIGEKCV
jgi:hypothetical protein